MTVDFRLIVRGGAGAHLPLDLTAFEEGPVIGEASRLYRRAKDGMEIVVKAFDVSPFEVGEVEIEIENLSNLRHPLIAAPIAFAVAEGEMQLKIGRLHATDGSLAEVVSSNRVWWTPTAKVKAVVGIALALRFAHGLGLLHGGVKARNVLFDGGGRIQIADFSPMRRAVGFSEEGWSPRADVSAFAMLLFEVTAGCPSPPPSVARAIGKVILRPPAPSRYSGVCFRNNRARAAPERGGGTLIRRHP
jgi:serine/threonine protein kinase